MTGSTVAGVVRGVQERLTAPGRLVGIDIARGLAVLGMFVVHVGLGWTLASGENALYGVVAGRSAALFAVLAGVSMAIISGGSRPKAQEADRGIAVWRIVMRALLILPVGVWLTLLGTGVSVILAYYSVFFLLAVSLLYERPRFLLGFAVALGVVGPLVSFYLRSQIAAGGSLGAGVNWLNGVDPLAVSSGHGLVAFLVTGSYPALTWMPFVLAGLAIGRLDLRSSVVRWSLVAVGSAVSGFAYIAAGVAMRQPAVFDRLAASTDPLTGEPFGAEGAAEALQVGFGGTAPSSSWAWTVIAAPHSGTVFEVFGAGGLAVAVLGLCLLAGEYLRWVAFPLASVGALALTVYVGHVVVIWLAEGGYLDRTPLAFMANELAWSVLLGALLFATLWRLFVGRGPLEWPLSSASTWVARRIP